ncbi:MAG: hypothetical protein AAFQ94_31215, partial [Bacteroidota bacterium]
NEQSTTFYLVNDHIGRIIPLMHQKQEALLSDFSSNESLPLHATNNTQKHELVLSWLEDFQ